MPSHIYFRLGRYSDAAESSALAAAVDRDYIQKHNPQGVSPMMFYQHNIYFLWAALCMEGRSTAALRSARELEANFPDDMVRQMRMLEFFRPVRLFSMARFGRWVEILKEPRPSADFPYLTGMWHYARGLASAATGRPRQAATEKDSLVAIATAVASRIPPEGNTASALLRLASSVLAGELEARQGKTEDSVRHLREAVRLQDKLRYDEPPPWYFPVRQSLGAVLLTAGRANEAESVYRDDLQKNPENGWSLYGLAKSLRAQKKHNEASSVEKRFRKAWARADVRLTASRF
jgi:tetratricopeptide (TPR) repeat protein